ncbi:hypothetical protein BC936DRAFT_148687 [Jimgerdemannia flammicorona]|uniref:DNA endonuclease activator Ctp1 C-terminal domain-containing protein n=1 Tax=Jimgerdemannia flammicorona TaxID=994334 RepID=A0A433DN75_9FUNG|nr:hypothetical protein BC936DRAFT_148687 [Jimgerdemannia flammicorona]
MTESEIPELVMFRDVCLSILEDGGVVPQTHPSRHGPANVVPQTLPPRRAPANIILEALINLWNDQTETPDDEHAQIVKTFTKMLTYYNLHKTMAQLITDQKQDLTYLTKRNGELHARINELKAGNVVAQDIATVTMTDRSSKQAELISRVMDRAVNGRDKGKTHKYETPGHKTRSDRCKLHGFDCKSCERFYNATGGLLVDIHGPQFRSSSHAHVDSRQRRLDLVSRHRRRYTPPSELPGFWTVDFPTDEEIAQQKKEGIRINSEKRKRGRSPSPGIGPSQRRRTPPKRRSGSPTLSPISDSDYFV